MSPMKQVPVADRFWKFVKKAPGCWLWAGCRDSRGYGRIGRGRGVSPYYSHRVSWEIRYGPIPRGMYILHHCDNPRCVRPSHLFIGTQADNMADAAKKGRLAVGEKNGNAKLSEQEVLELRRLHATGIYTQAVLAERFRVSQQHVSSVASGRRWAHVQ